MPHRFVRCDRLPHCAQRVDRLGDDSDQAMLREPCGERRGTLANAGIVEERRAAASSAHRSREHGNTVRERWLVGLPALLTTS